MRLNIDATARFYNRIAPGIEPNALWRIPQPGRRLGRVAILAIPAPAPGGAVGDEFFTGAAYLAQWDYATDEHGEVPVVP